jgi:hypothetical protein
LQLIHKCQFYFYILIINNSKMSILKIPFIMAPEKKLMILKYKCF